MKIARRIFLILYLLYLESCSRGSECTFTLQHGLDGNGYIDYFEFSQLFHFTFGNFQISDNSLGSEQDFAMEDKELSEKCRKIFSRLDKNERGKISMPEFVHGLRDDPVMIASFTLF